MSRHVVSPTEVCTSYDLLIGEIDNQVGYWWSFILFLILYGFFDGTHTCWLYCLHSSSTITADTWQIDVYSSRTTAVWYLILVDVTARDLRNKFWVSACSRSVGWVLDDQYPTILFDERGFEGRDGLSLTSSTPTFEIQITSYILVCLRSFRNRCSCSCQMP